MEGKGFSTQREFVLDKPLVPFYSMAGWLGKDEDGQIEFDSNIKGVLFMKAKAKRCSSWRRRRRSRSLARD